jgi:Inhibitor of Apoptosis domain
MTHDLNTRLVSFNDVCMVKDLKVTYAEAGFIYKGNFNIFVECFHCGVQLKSIDDSTDPWYPWYEKPWWAHAQKNSGCEYVIFKKGKSFVKNVEIYHNGTQALV